MLLKSQAVNVPATVNPKALYPPLLTSVNAFGVALTCTTLPSAGGNWVWLLRTWRPNPEHKDNGC